MDSNTTRIAVTGLIILLLLGTLVFVLVRDRPECGDGACDEDERCCTDCGCAAGQQCDPDSERCVAADRCGDGTCGRGENCCFDCGCTAPEVCDGISKRCVRPSAALCGNGVCESGESPASCCGDCGCGQPGYACNHTSGTCVKRGHDRICGDSICDFGESVDTCCDDCRFCETGMHCDTGTHRCVVDVLEIDPNAAIQAFQVHLREQGLDIDWITRYQWKATASVYEGVPVLKVCNILPENADTVGEYVCGMVDEDYEIVSVARHW